MGDRTLFEKILDGDIPSEMLHEDATCAAFLDINPQAPTHILVVPRKPIPGISAMTDDDEVVVGHLLNVARQLAAELGFTNGFRLVINDGADGGQEVPHLHVHLLAGRQMTWPPG